MRIYLGIWIGWHLLMVACSDSSTKDHSGVTSTGNAGDVAGYVVARQGVGLGREQAVVALSSVDSALVVLSDAEGNVVDSMRSNREGAFRFRNISAGDYELTASLAGKKAFLTVTAEEMGAYVSRLQLGETSKWLMDTLPVGIYSALPGRVWSSITGRYSYDSANGSIRFIRTFDSDSILAGVWQVFFLDPEMFLWNPNQNGCTSRASFFSLASRMVEGNHWFYNGNLAEDYGGVATVCSQPLEGLPEMRLFGMSGLELQFNENGRMKGIFYDRSWCLTQSVSMAQIYGSSIPDDAQIAVRDCNSFQVNRTNGDSTIVRVLWLDLAAEWGEEEIRHGTSSWIRRGSWSQFSVEQPR